MSSVQTPPPAHSSLKGSPRFRPTLHQSLPTQGQEGSPRKVSWFTSSPCCEPSGRPQSPGPPGTRLSPLQPARSRKLLLLFRASGPLHLLSPLPSVPFPGLLLARLAHLPSGSARLSSAFPPQAPAMPVGPSRAGEPRKDLAPSPSLSITEAVPSPPLPSLPPRLSSPAAHSLALSHRWRTKLPLATGAPPGSPASTILPSSQISTDPVLRRHWPGHPSRGSSQTQILLMSFKPVQTVGAQ